ncbi:hypothetical protein F8N00_09025 [Exiguobacterium sp. A1_3_1]|uniref:hypothetical protein n=1 Tax=Exiguobacterium sp. A1_3_1 TaxID=2651871 RepID=UPI003B86E635
MTSHNDPKQTANALASGQTSDSVLRSIAPDLIVTSLNESQVQEFIKGLSDHPDRYFRSNTIGVDMTDDQYHRVSGLIKLLLNSLNEDNDFYSEICEINLTDHFLERLELRSDKFTSVSPEEFSKIRGYIAGFKDVSMIFRWNHRGITYVLAPEAPSQDKDRIIVSLKKHRNKTLKVIVHAITYYED